MESQCREFVLITGTNNMPDISTAQRTRDVCLEAGRVRYGAPSHTCSFTTTLLGLHGSGFSVWC